MLFENWLFNLQVKAKEKFFFEKLFRIRVFTIEQVIQLAGRVVCICFINSEMNIFLFPFIYCVKFKLFISFHCYQSKNIRFIRYFVIDYIFFFSLLLLLLFLISSKYIYMLVNLVKMFDFFDFFFI